MSENDPKYFEVTAEITSVIQLTDNTVSCRVFSPEIARSALPGQFVNIQVNQKNSNTPVLRRPFAVSSVIKDEFEFIFNIVGRGTSILKDSLKNAGQINILGPLGNGFDINNGSKEKLLIAGGIGIAPLKSLADCFYSQNIPVTLFWGNRKASDFFSVSYFERNNTRLLTASDDGSAGFKGNVLELIRHEIEAGRISDLKMYDIYAVGPDPMMKAVAGYVEGAGARCQVSLETPMACGMGVCQGCAVVKRSGEGYYLVCKEGPVFYSDEIQF